MGGQKKLQKLRGELGLNKALLSRLSFTSDVHFKLPPISYVFYFNGVNLGCYRSRFCSTQLGETVERFEVVEGVGDFLTSIFVNTELVGTAGCFFKVPPCLELFLPPITLKWTFQILIFRSTNIQRKLVFPRDYIKPKSRS